MRVISLGGLDQHGVVGADEEDLTLASRPRSRGPYSFRGYGFPCPVDIVGCENSGGLLVWRESKSREGVGATAVMGWAA
jgi:hypothetical protein